MNGVEFRYTAFDARGERQRGVVSALDASEAYRKLTASGLTPVDVRERRRERAWLSSQRVGLEDIASLTRELSVLMEAKIPLSRGLASIAEQESKPMLNAMLRDIAGKVESGSSLTAALESYSALFGEVYLQTMRAAERSGNLATVLSHLAEMLDRQMEVRQQLRRAMMYPAVVITMVFLAVGVLVVFVIPRFAETFASQGVEMPLLTRVLRDVGESVRSYWYAYAGGAAGLAVAARVGLSSARGKRAVELGLSRLPYISGMISATTAAQFTRVLSIALASGLDLIDSITIGARATGRALFATECAEVTDKLRRGVDLNGALGHARMLPSFARRMMAAGKDSTELARACGVVARHFDRESNHRSKNINAALEPALTVAMAGVVLLVALSVFLPMWKMMRLHH